MENVTKTNNSQTLVSTTYTITAGDVTDLMKNLMALGADASQEQLAEVVNGRALKEICAVSNLGESISGSAERAVAAALNVLLPPARAAQYSADDDYAGCVGWFTSEHGDKDKMAKDLAPHKKEIFAAWKHSSNVSTKYKRVRRYGAELAYTDLYTLEERDQHRAELIAETGETGETGESEGGKPSRNRDLYERSICEGGALYRALTSTTNNDIIKKHPKSEELTGFLEHLTRALTAAGAPLEDDELVALMKQLAKR
jgi:hypothetical protein